MSDLINRADAIRVISEEYHNRGGNFDGLDAIRELETLPLKGGDAEILNEDFRPKYMQQCPNNGADLISRADAIDVVAEEWLSEASAESPYVNDYDIDKYRELAEELFEDVPSADAVQGWIPCSERLPKINQRVLLATNEERVFVGYKEKPDIVWRVTEADGREHWVYDPENYTDDIDVLPKDEDCGFAKDDVYADGFLSVTSINYDDRFEGVIAWMPLPEPYREDGEV